MGERWTILTARQCIERNSGKVGVNVIHCSRPGLTVLGAIDYLCHYCGHLWVRG